MNPRETEPLDVPGADLDEDGLEVGADPLGGGGLGRYRKAIAALLAPLALWVAGKIVFLEQLLDVDVDENLISLAVVSAITGEIVRRTSNEP